MFVTYGSRAQRQYCRFGHIMSTNLDVIGSAVCKRTIGHAIATTEWTT